MTMLKYASFEPMDDQGPGGPKVSVVLPARNEHPQVLTTILSIHEELEYWGYEHEFIVVSNQSDDNMPEVLEDRFRNWIKQGLLKVVRFDDRPACWHARNVGVEQATGDVLIVSDAHMSVAIGTLHSMIRHWQLLGGLWFSASQMWGDPTPTRLHGYRLQLREKFWGSLSRAIPKAVVDVGRPAYTVPMAQFSLFLVGRQEFNEAGRFHPAFKCYGGGEPYFALKWWRLGKKVWILPKGLVRHAFGLSARWKKFGRGQDYRGQYIKNHGILLGKDNVPEGAEYLHYGRDYSWDNDMMWFNFLLAAYTIGGLEWFEQRRERYVQQCNGVAKYLDSLETIAKEAKSAGEEDRVWIDERAEMTLDQLIERSPWDDLTVQEL